MYYFFSLPNTDPPICMYILSSKEFLWPRFWIILWKRCSRSSTFVSLQKSQIKIWSTFRLLIKIYVNVAALLASSTLDLPHLATPHNLRVCAWWKVPVKRFKICHNFDIRKPMYFFVFHFMLLYFFPNECPSLCRHRPGHSLGEKTM